ncbi:MAG: hypothetical protein HW421_2369 [Ignavibacteria bacterium]|nr:hypothetical protein [Ignavibacteria bacterium]
MKPETKLELMNEIKQLERNLYSKKSKLGSVEAMDNNSSKTFQPPYIGEHGLDLDKWKQDFEKLITSIGECSIGGNSVDDIKFERVR